MSSALVSAPNTTLSSSRSRTASGIRLFITMFVLLLIAVRMRGLASEIKITFKSILSQILNRAPNSSLRKKRILNLILFFALTVVVYYSNLVLLFFLNIAHFSWLKTLYTCSVHFNYLRQSKRQCVLKPKITTYCSSRYSRISISRILRNWKRFSE